MAYPTDDSTGATSAPILGQDQDQGEATGADQDDAEDDTGADDEDILELGRARLAIAEEAESDIRRLALDDITFSSGEQWPTNIQQDRERDGRPCLVINRIPQFVQQITNDQRQNRPSIKVHPIDDEADVETAKTIEGLVRHVEYNSNADVAYDTAFDSAVRGGFGFYRVVTDFVSPESFDQEIYIRRMRNAFSCFLDPSHQEPDGSDAEWGFVLDWLTKDEYERKYPDSELAASVDQWRALGDRAPNWMKEGSVRVAEYFYKEYKDETVHQLSTGETVKDADLQSRLDQAQKAGLDVLKVRTRKVKVPVVKWIKMNGVEILERTTWLGKYIPIIPVYGNEIYIDGKKILESLVRHAKDPQRMLNYWKSAQTEAIALAPRAPFLVAEGQIEGYEEIWKTANRKSHPYLPYKPSTIAGVTAPPPAPMTFEPAIQGITGAAMQAADDLKAVTGLYDPSLGAGPADTSGVAIQKRNIQAQTSNFHFMDNLTRSMKHTGRILVDLIPRIYDTARTMRIIGDDGTQQVVKVNQVHKDEHGKEILYQLDAGTYDVTIDVGPSYASKRQEAAASMQSLAQSYPKLMDIAGDLYVKNMDWPGATEIAERIKKTLPPGLANDPSKGPEPIPQQAQMQMQQQAQMIDTLTKQLHGAVHEIETKQFELQSRERIEAMRIQADLEIALLKTGSQESIALLENEIGAINTRLKMIGYGQPVQPPSDQPPQNPNPSAPPAAGGNASAAPGTQPPTGGASPGQPMEQ